MLQSNKPIMEKRRRARINNCLNDLKALILDAMKKDVSIPTSFLFTSYIVYFFPFSCLFFSTFEDNTCDSNIFKNLSLFEF